MQSDIFELCKELVSLQKQLVVQVLDYSGVEVDFIISNQIKDEKRIEHALDLLLDAAFDEQVLEIFKKLCRYYYFLNPESAIWYVNQYKESYDDELVR